MYLNYVGPSTIVFPSGGYVNVSILSGLPTKNLKRSVCLFSPKMFCSVFSNFKYTILSLCVRKL